MMDHYGSIIKSEHEIDSELIKRFRDRCHESYMKQIISDLRKEGVLHKEYSFSGWMVFHGKTICEIIEKTINYRKQKSENKIKFLYCFNQLFNDIDICKLICDKI